MPSIIQPLPTVAGVTGELARQLLRLVGPAYPAPNESLNAADALALGGALAAALATTEGSLDEAFPNTATYLLSEWEAMLGLPVSAGRLTTAERRAALLARWRTRFAGTPDAMVAALTPINGTPPPLRETVANESTENPPRVFAFTFMVGADPNDPAAIAPFVATVGVMKPAHTMAQFTNLRTDGFFCNDPLSLTNNTVL